MSLDFENGAEGLVLRGIPAITNGLVKGHPAFIEVLQQGAVTPPEGAFDEPLTILARPSSAPHLTYPLWAFWLPVGRLLEPDLPAMAEWWAELPSARRELPVLVLARAQGQWDFHRDFSPRLPALLYESDPLATPNGRVLLQAGLPSVSLSDSLTKAVRCFFRTIDPASTEAFPIATMLVRSGVGNVALQCGFPAKVQFEGVQPSGEALPVPPITLPPGLQANLTLKGPFVWGAWRVAANPIRFLGLSSRGARGVRTAFSVSSALTPAGIASFHEKLRSVFPECETPIEDSRDQAPPAAEGRLPRAASALFARAMRGLERNLAQDSFLAESLSRSYGEILRIAETSPLSLHQAAAFPAPEPADPGPRDSTGPTDGLRVEELRRTPSTSGPILPLLGAPRSVRVVVADLLEAPEPTEPSAGSTVGSDSVGNAVAIRRERIVGRLLEDAVRTVSAHRELAEGINVLRTCLSIRRPPEILLPGLERLPGIGSFANRLSAALREQCSAAAEVELSAEATLPVSTHGWRTTVSNAHRRHDRMSEVSLAVQRTLRAFTPLLARSGKEDFRQVAAVKALLLYECSAAQAPREAGEMANDPHEGDTLAGLLRSARNPLARRTVGWNERLGNVKARPWALNSLAARNQLIQETECRPGHLIHILMAEKNLCDSVGRLLRGMGRVARSGKLHIIRQRSLVRRVAAKAACGIQAATLRLLPHGRGEDLGGLIAMVALHAAARSGTPLAIRYTFQAYDHAGNRLGVPLRWEHATLTALDVRVESERNEETPGSGYSGLFGSMNAA